jgi:hypothetical protein
MMKRIVLMSLLALALPLAAFADNPVDFQNDGGTLTGSSSGLTLTGSTLNTVTGLNGGGKIQGNLGTLSFTTGAENGTAALTTDTSFAAGGTFTITGNGTNGVPNETLFTGTFTSPVTWIAYKLSDGQYKFTMSGMVSGTWYTGATVSGATIQIATTTGGGGFTGTATLGSGDTNIDAPTVPEPGTLGLLGTGLIGVAGALRRKMKS